MINCFCLILLHCGCCLFKLCSSFVQTKHALLPFWLSILIERIWRIQVGIAETELQLVVVLSLLVAGNGQLRSDVVHLQLANCVHIALEVVLAEILHQFLYPSQLHSTPTSSSNEIVHLTLCAKVLHITSSPHTTTLWWYHKCSVRRRIRSVRRATTRSRQQEWQCTLHLGGARIERFPLELVDDLLLLCLGVTQSNGSHSVDIVLRHSIESEHPLVVFRIPIKHLLRDAKPERFGVSKIVVSRTRSILDCVWVYASQNRAGRDHMFC